MNSLVRCTCASLLTGAILLAGGCEPPPKPYGAENQMFLPGAKTQVWAVAPAVNLSGEKAVDPILQADLLYQQLQQVHGLTVVPVNRVVEVYAGLHIEKIESAQSASLVCDLLGCDAIVVPTVTVYDPYDPPKMGGSLQVFAKPTGFVRPANIDVRELSRSATPLQDASLAPPQATFLQAVGFYDAANGSVRDAVFEYARGRHDPLGPMGPNEYLASMDRYGGFFYSSLASDLLKQLEARQPVAAKKKDDASATSEGG